MPERTLLFEIRGFLEEKNNPNAVATSFSRDIYVYVDLDTTDKEARTMAMQHLTQEFPYCRLVITDIEMDEIE